MDWNNDGHLDILSGCYWTDDAKAGHIYMLTGSGSLDFSTAIAIRNPDGEPLENAKVPDGESEAQIKTICTQQHAVDYDGDGDLDLVVGCFGPHFFYYENRGTKESPALSSPPIELPVVSTDYHSAPHLADWDGDGDLDLLTGTRSGGALISRNQGTREKPDWSDFEQLLPGSKMEAQSFDGGPPSAPASNSRLWVTDWNRDGLLDLLVGDQAYVVIPKAGLSRSEFEAKKKEHEEKMTAIGKEAAKFHQLSEPDDGDDAPDVADAFAKWQQRYLELYQSRSEFMDEERTGFVWLYVRKHR